MLFVFDHEFVSSRSFYKFIFSFFFFKEDDNFSLIFFIPYVVVKTQKKRLSNLAISIFQLVRQPVEAFIESIAGSGTCCLNIPIPVSQRMESQFVRDLCSVHGVRQILFVSENQEHSLPELVLSEHSHQLIPGLPDTFAIV